MVMRWIRFFIIFISLLCMGLVGFARIYNIIHEKNNKGTLSFYALSYSWHKGIIIPRNWLEVEMGLIPVGQGEWLEIGWGERAYYMYDAHSATGILRAIALPSAGVMHIVPLTNDVINYMIKDDENLNEYSITPSQRSQIINYIQQSFSPNALTQPLGHSLYGDGAFFASDYKYHLFFTCNSWVANIMNKAGYVVFPFLSQHPALLHLQYK